MTDKPKLPDLSLREKPPGLEAFAELVAAARTGRAPSPQAVRELAEASIELFSEGPARERLERFGRRLGMFVTRGKGRKPDGSAGTFADRIGPVGFVVQAERRFLAEGMGKREAHARAIRETSERCAVAARTLQRWFRELYPRADELLAEIEEKGTVAERLMRKKD